jgi:isoquinoline 1-oxidoreductase beta subunit
MLHVIEKLIGARPLARAATIVRVDRRTFLTGSAASGFALAAMPAGAFEPYYVGGEDMPHGLVTDPLVFVAIDPDGTVTITAHRSEMGTGSRTSLPMVVADEMGADWDRVVIVQAPGDEPKYGNQDTDGSRSMRHHIQSMRQIGASVRTMLARAAAAEWQVDPTEVVVGVHEVTGPGGQTLGLEGLTSLKWIVLGQGETRG